MPIAAAAIGGGTKLLEGFLARQDEQRARKLAESEKRNALGFLTQAGSTDALFQALQEAQLKTGQAKQLKAFGGAKTALDLGADAARRDVLNQGARTQADATQGLISKGLIGTSAGTGVANDISGQTTQQLANIDQQLAEAFANLNLEQGQTEADQSNELAALLGSGRQFQQQLGLARTDFAPASGGSSKRHGLGGLLQSFTPAGLLGAFG